MLKGATARRYAEAVFEIGEQSETIERWRDDLRVLGEYFGNARLAFILNEPKIPYQRKAAIVRDLLSAKLRSEALNLALMLVERGLVGIAPRISSEYERLYNDYRGQAVAQVTTAIPLDDEMRTRLTRELQEITGKRILLEERVDPSILGGAIARVGDTLIDGSLRRRFAVLRGQIAAGGGFGGPNDGDAPALLAPDGDGGAGTGGAPFVVGPSTATETAPRPADGPHVAPRNNPPSSSGNDGANPGRPGGRNKRRRR
ncbi:MAG: ATP synthase F1 subunit delta [Ktedonobacterales bacterium]